jgi:parallel beta-helix repeat protein
VKGSYCKITDNVAVGLHLNGSFNEVSRNSFGIFVEGESNVIKDNVCTALHMSHANNNFVLENRVWSDSRDYSGIDVAWSDDNVFCRNEVSGFSYDFRLWFSSRNTIVANTIADSLAASISFGDSSSNKIYLNNFVDNPSENKPYVYDFYTDGNYRSAHPDMTLSTNSWDDGTRGNYWENFEVSDVNGDGAGEASYLINVNNQDDFPLVATVDISEVPVELPELPELPEIPELHVALPVVLLNPINTTYAVGYVSLDFVVDKRAVWTGYSLDGHANVTASENLTLEGVSDGAHTLTVYANDTFGFTGASETITFTVATFPTALVAVAVLVSAVAISAGLLLYFKKRKH